MRPKRREIEGEALQHRLSPYIFLTIASPNSEHFTSVAPCVKRAKSYVTTLASIVF